MDAKWPPDMTSFFLPSSIRSPIKWFLLKVPFAGHPMQSYPHLICPHMPSITLGCFLHNTFISGRKNSSISTDLVWWFIPHISSGANNNHNKITIVSVPWSKHDSYSMFTALRNILLMPYFIVQKTKAQEGYVTCPRPHR